MGTVSPPAVIVAGYPRSANVWLARLLGDALDWPVVGIHGGRSSLAAEGLDRPGAGSVVQAHVWPGTGPSFWHDSLRVDLARGEGYQVLTVVRDPRDVAVSAAEFWAWPLDRALDCMIVGPGPLGLPPWAEYVGAWLAAGVPGVRYEDLRAGPHDTLARVLVALDRPPCKPLVGVVARQAFDAKRTEMEAHGDDYAFGKEAQLHHLRRGGVGEWRDRFTAAQAAQALAAWGPIMAKLGYE